MTEPMIVDPSGAAMPHSGGFLWTTPDMYDPVKEKPAFRVQVVAEVFFGRSAPWLRKWQRQASESTDLGKVESLRSRAGYHHYRLYDIERLAHVFAEHKVIDGDHLLRVVGMVRLVAQTYGFIPSIPLPSMDPQDEMPLGYTGFQAIMPNERAAALHLVNRVLTDHPVGTRLPFISCVNYGNHRHTAGCKAALNNAVRALRRLEKHLREVEDPE